MPSRKAEALGQDTNKAIRPPGADSSNSTHNNLAKLLCGPEYSAMRVIQALETLSGGYCSRSMGQDHLPALTGHLKAQAHTVNNGGMNEPEAMLMNQAIALQSLFTRLAEIGAYQTNMPLMESFLKLAMKAQSQCRTTLEALANIKNPPNVAFVAQANIAQNQQVNNAHPVRLRTRTPENKSQQNELLEVHHAETLDFGTTTATSGTHPEMATMAKVHRAKNRCRQRTILKECQQGAG